MQLTEAQHDMSKGYIGGAPGVLVSGLVWLLAGSVNVIFDRQSAFAVLFFGGMLIVPASIGISRACFGAKPVANINPLSRLGFEGTVVLFAGILICYALLRAAPEYAFPALALAIGARYFAFRTIYDEPAYWALGGLIAGTATMAILDSLPHSLEPLFLVGATECLFAIILLLRWRRRFGASENG